MTREDRRILSISVKPDLYARLQQHCRTLDRPMTVWVRDLIKEHLPPETHD
jgi:predicted DNA-binding protein